MLLVLRFFLGQWVGYAFGCCWMEFERER